MNTKKKNILTYCCIIVLMLIVSCVFFSPVLQGKVLPQGDLQKYEGMAKAQKDYHERTGEYANWCPSMFGGMPGYQITQGPQHSIFTPINKILTLSFLGRQHDIGIMFIYLMGFFMALCAIGFSPWLALLGAIAFALGSYNIVIIEAGHITKAYAMALMAPIFAGMLLAFRRKHLLGAIVFTLALGVQIAFNHIQITYYTAIGGVVLGMIYLIYSLCHKQFKPFLMSCAVLLIGCAFAIGCNATQLFVNQEYVKHTMRGGSEITVTPESVTGEPSNTGKQSEGLDIDYAYSWSYGVGETYTILVPGALGGGSMEPVSKESASYQSFRQNMMPLYWGDQPFTSGPVYFGALIVFLFVLGLFVVKGPERWWLLIATLIAIVLSWGRNFMPLNEFLFNNLPLYNKFRTPSMSLVLANVAMVFMAVMALKSIIEQREENKASVPQRINIALYVATGITGAIIIMGMLLCGGFSFTGVGDLQMAEQYGDQWSYIQDIFIKDRKALFMSDSWRSLIIVLVGAGALWLYVNNKLKKPALLMGILIVVTTIDLWNVDRRYLNSDRYSKARDLELRRDAYDYAIDEQAAQFGDKDYRVYNMLVNTYNDSKPAAFHNLIGGYSAAKLSRYQDLIDFHINQGSVGEAFNKHIGHYATAFAANPQWTPWDSIAVLDMLNTRYMVWSSQGGMQVTRRNTALGNVWFVDDVKWVDNADAEILALGDFDPSRTVVVDKKWEAQIGKWSGRSDSSATIEKEIASVNNPDYLKYISHSASDQIAVFSEIYYAPDWRCYIDGKPTDYFQCNYVLRGMVVPAGDHTIEFKNEAPTLHKLNTVSLICSIVLVLALAGAVVVVYNKKRQKS